jgi:signal transduction histidine kinase
MTNGQLLFLSGDDLYVFGGNQIRKWISLPAGTIPVAGARLYFIDKEQSVIIHSSPQHVILHVSSNGKVTHLRDDFALTLTQINQDSLFAIVIDAAFQNSFLNYSTVTHHFTESKHKILLEQMLTTPVRDAMNRQNIKVKHLGDWHFFPLSGNRWAVSCNEGLFLLYTTVDQLFKPITPTKGQRIRGVVSDRYNNIIYGTYSGLYWYNMKTEQGNLITKDKTVIWTITATSASNDRFIAAGEGGKQKFMFLRSYPTGVILDSVRILNEQYSHCTSILKDKYGEGYWYIEGNNDNYRLSHLHPKTFESHTISPAIKTLGVRSMAQNEALWIGCIDGLIRVDISGQNRNTFNISKQQIPPVLQKVAINTLLADKEEGLWIGTQGAGLYYYNFKKQIIQQYSKLDGLADNTVFSLIASSDSILWVGTGGGLSRLDISQKKLQNYFIEDGLSDNEFNTAAAHLTDQGYVLMGGQNGINYFEPQRFITQNTSCPNFLEIRINHLNGTSNTLFVTDGVEIIVEPSANILEINFRSSNILNADKRYFRYRINNLGDNWQYIYAGDKAVFGKLSNGSYLLEVQSQSPRGMWEASSFFRITVLPPWYKTWWFKILLTISICGLLFMLYRLRIEYLRREFELRQQISHDLHDSLGTRMFLLRSLSNRIVNPLLSEQERKEQLLKLEDISKEAFSNVRDFIWAFDPKLDSISQLFDRMEDFAENYLSVLIGSLLVQRDRTQENGTALSPRVKYHLINIYQEILTNMVKHTSCQSLTISLLVVDGNTISIRIINKHKGYNNNAMSDLRSQTRKGKESIDKRLREIKATLEWQTDQPGKQVADIVLNI